MKVIKSFLAVLLAAVWISVSEFARNQFLLKSYWVNHYHDLGLSFPSKPVNGALWGLWSLLFAYIIFIVAKKFSLLHTVLLTWVSAFAMMWLVIGNLSVLPFGILWSAVPLSILEALIATWIIKYFQK